MAGIAPHPDPEDPRAIVYNFLGHELHIENPRAKYGFQRVYRLQLGKPRSTSSTPIILRFLRFTEKAEGVMSVARKKLKDKDFYMYDDISKDLYDLRKQQRETFKQARDKGYKVHLSKAHPDELFVNGQFLPPDQPLE